MISRWTTLGKREHRDRVTVRELGGDVWGELERARRNGASPFDRLDLELEDAMVDLVMGVLARHTGALLVNDGDLPVTPRPRPIYRSDANYEPEWLIAALAAEDRSAGPSAPDQLT